MVNLPISISTLTRFGYLYPSYSNITPFTYQDGQTFSKMLEELIQYIDGTLTTETDANTQALVDAWKSSVEELIELVLNNSIELQDPLLATIIVDETSEARVALDTILATLIQEDPDDLGTYMIMAPAVIPGDGSMGTPDPDNPGFWLD